MWRASSVERLGVMGMPGLVWLVQTASTSVVATWAPTCASRLHIATLNIALLVKIIPIMHIVLAAPVVVRRNQAPRERVCGCYACFARYLRL